MAMNMRIWLLATACATTLCASLQSQTEGSTAGAKQTNSSAKKTEKNAVSKLDGTKLFGFIEVTDDYTIRISNDSGITRLPIAQLGDADFQKYGFQKDRSKDGRFWYRTQGGAAIFPGGFIYPRRIRNPRAGKNLAKALPSRSDWGKSRPFSP